MLQAAEDASRTMGLQLQVVEAPRPHDFDQAFSVLAKVRARGVLIVNSPTTIIHRSEVVAMAAKSRLAAIYEYRNWAEAGGLMSYGPTLSDAYSHLADCADKILKGAKPADIPVQQATKFELVINLKTAKALGLTIPQSVLGRADQVIE
jgi:putative ABC transport system substrate-binding protein